MKILILIRYLIPMLLMDVDDKLGKDLARWQEIHHISAPRCHDGSAVVS